MRRLAVSVAAVVACTGISGIAPGVARPTPNKAQRYLVLYKDGSKGAAHAALARLGARILQENEAIGLATVKARASFRDDALASGAFAGVAHDHAIARIPLSAPKLQLPRTTSNPVGSRKSFSRRASGGSADPLFKRQLWYMDMIDATPAGSYSVDKGDARVLVGVMDSGIDVKNFDLHQGVDRDLSRNFTRDIPSIDGNCEDEVDHSCEDPPLTDDGGHGTSVASLISGDVNGFGISGVAPDVTLVSLRATQDSGYVFLQPVVDALTYAADHGIDVVNMSFYIDPWLLNCPSNPADSAEDQAEQRMIVEAVQEAADYARAHNVTMVSAAGNDHLNLDDPRVDDTSPDFPAGESYHRDVDDSCVNMPAEASGVVGTTGLGPSERKSFLSNYGLDVADVAAPSGDQYDGGEAADNQLFTAWSRQGLLARGLISKEGNPAKSSGVVRRCRKPHHKQCSYYFSIEGTSGSSPLAAAVAALIVGRIGTNDGAGLSADPAAVEAKLFASSTPHACPEGEQQRYPEIGARADDFTATCAEGPSGTNGFYGHGIVNALNAVQGPD